MNQKYCHTFKFNTKKKEKMPNYSFAHISTGAKIDYIINTYAG